MIAVGNKHKYNGTNFNVAFSGDKHVGVAVMDYRRDVSAGTKNLDFSGYSRGGFGNPFNVGTASGRPIAEDMAETIANSIAAKGYKVCHTYGKPSEKVPEALARLKAVDAQTKLVVVLRDWKSDTFMLTCGITYDIDVYVLDSNDATKYELKHQGVDKLGGSFWNPPKHAKKNVPLGYLRRLEAIFSDPKLAEVLNS